MSAYITKNVELTILVSNTLSRTIGAIWMLLITGTTVAKCLKTSTSFHLLMDITVSTTVLRKAMIITGATQGKGGITALQKWDLTTKETAVTMALMRLDIVASMATVTTGAISMVVVVMAIVALRVMVISLPTMDFGVLPDVSTTSTAISVRYLMAV